MEPNNLHILYDKLTTSDLQRINIENELYDSPVNVNQRTVKMMNHETFLLLLNTGIASSHIL